MIEIRFGRDKQLHNCSPPCPRRKPERRRHSCTTVSCGVTGSLMSINKSLKFVIETRDPVLHGNFREPLSDPVLHELIELLLIQFFSSGSI